jgi:hypothetical protein
MEKELSVVGEGAEMLLNTALVASATKVPDTP